MKIGTTILMNILISSLVSAGIFGLGYYWLLDESPLLTDSDQQDVTRSEASPSINATVPDVVEQAIPAVVSISISADVPVYEQSYEDFWSPFGGFFGDGFGFQVPRQRQIGTERQEIGGGTGFIVSPDGYVVTNRHVVDQEGVSYTAIMNDGTTHEANVVAKDPTFDVAILKINVDTNLPYLSFASTSEARLGESVIAIGNALAEFPNSVSVGVISGLSRDIVASDGFRRQESLEGVIQTDAAINRGNSGGPLLNLNGDVVGVNVAVAGGGENIGFALPVDVVSSIVETVRKNGEIVRPFLGVRYLPITETLASENNLPVDYGVLILRGESRTELAVIPGSPADKAGLEENDIILEVDGQKLDAESPSLATLLRSYQVGDTLTLLVLHDGEEKEILVTLEAFGGD